MQEREVRQLEPTTAVKDSGCAAPRPQDGIVAWGSGVTKPPIAAASSVRHSELQELAERAARAALKRS